MSGEDAAAVIQIIAESSYPNRTVQAVAFAILYYDYVLTLPEEVERYWTAAAGRSWASFFFFLNRYMSVLCHIPVIFEFFATMPESRCHSLQLYHQLLAALTQLVVGTLLILRTYALYNRSRRVIYLLSCISILGGAISVWAVLSVRGSPVPPPDVSLWVGCDLRISQKQGYYLAAAWSSIMAFDIVVFLLTSWQALHAGRMWSHSLFHVILRDGTLYFGVLAVCYLSNILTYVFVQPKHKGILTTLTNVISATLVTRMMLNIRNPDLLDLPHRWPSEHELW